MERGMSFVSNDRLLVRRNGDDLQMAGIPKMPRINPGTAAGSPRLKTILTDEDRNLCERLSMEELWEYERKYDVMVAELFGEDRLVIAPVHMRGLVILNWKRITGEVRFKEVDIRRRIDLMEAFMKNPGIFYRSPGRGSRGEHSRERYLECLGNCPVYELYGEVDFVGAAAACIGLMETNTAYGPKG
jgi:HprK-related kinase B